MGLTHLKTLRIFGIIPNTMAIKILYRGIEITVQSPTEAAVLVRELSDGGLEISEAPAKSPMMQITRNTGESNLTLAIKFLTAIATNEEGITQIDALPILGVNSGRAIGGRIYAIQNVLKRNNLKPEETYITALTAKGKAWMRGPMIVEALEILEAARI